jgi:antitoxin MazE
VWSGIVKQSVVRWGNSLAVRIPSAVAKPLGLAERSQVTLLVTRGKLLITPTETIPDFSDKDLRKALRLLKKAKRADRVATLELGKPVGREVW